MGLDMYLERRNYVKNWDHMKPEEKHSILIKKDGKIVKDIDPEKISYVIEEVGYWRKANAIHAWFIKNCADGNDGQSNMYVSHEKLEELLKTVSKVLDASELIEGKIQNGTRYTKEGGKQPIMQDGKFVKECSIANELLPTAEGFFFGSTSYDQYYIQDLESTKKILTDILKLKDDHASYYYEASW